MPITKKYGSFTALFSGCVTEPVDKFFAVGVVRSTTRLKTKMYVGEAGYFLE
jgi:hypothetical protein